MRQVRVKKRGSTEEMRRQSAALLDTLPLDPRDPDIVRAKRLRRAGVTTQPRPLAA